VTSDRAEADRDKLQVTSDRAEADRDKLQVTSDRAEADRDKLSATYHLSPVTCHEFEAFCPKIKCASGGRKGEGGERFKPLFPSYIFIRGDLRDPASHHLVKYTRGVNKVLGDGCSPVPIADEIIELIRGRVNEGGLIEQKTFKQGDLIKVKKGYLRDLIGILERPVSDSGRVAVLLQMFNRQMRVHLNCSDIARA